MSRPILVVDDSFTVRMDLTEALTGADLRVVSSATLADARAALGRERFGLVILDVILPDGDGLELLRELRAASTDPIPVMLLSTEAEVRDRMRGLGTGANDYVGKPYDTGYVVARARELVRRDSDRATHTTAPILVIDDSITFRQALRDALVAAGHDVVLADNGEDGLRIAADLRPSAIVVDAVLPGIHGSAVVRRLRLDAALRRTPCVLLTASEGEGAELRALEAGADAFVRKEEDIDVILARISAVMRSSLGSAEQEKTSSLLGPKKLLAVDDSPTFLHEVADVLRGEGYDVILARSGEEALELLAVQPVDCILLDLVMPGIGGEETCRRIKAAPTLRDIPLVMLTALDDRDAMLRGLSSGADDFIAKSSERAVLKARVVAQLRRKQFEDENRSIREQLLSAALEASEARAARELAETRASLLDDLERKNKELEAFSYSVSHDLRAPLRSIDGFSRALLEDHADSLDAKGKEYLQRVRNSAKRMGELIEDLLHLSRVSRAAMRWIRVDLAELARQVAAELRRSEPARSIEVEIAPEMRAEGDPGLLKVVFENLIGNAWKFTTKTEGAKVEVGRSEQNGQSVYFVRDNGAGFDMKYAARLFGPFQRLHSEADFPGTGIGLATVRRIVERHGGRIWAEGNVGQGAAISWTLGHGKVG